MSLLSIVSLIIAALVGMFIGHPLSKASGRKEEAKAAEQKQVVAQAQEAVKAVQERANVEAEVAAATDDELDQRLSRHNRAG